MFTQNLLRALFVASGAFVLLGCEADRGYVQREWSVSMRELGIVPMFPPREDVYVGDVYAYSHDPEDPRVVRIFERPWGELSTAQKQLRMQMGMSSRLAKLNVNELILADYQNRISAPSTPSDFNTILGNPAMAAAEEQVNTANRALKALEEKVSGAKKDLAAAAEDLKQKTRDKEDAQKNLDAAKAELAAAPTKPKDTSVQEAELKEAQRAQSDALLKLNDAKLDPDLTSSDATKQAEAKQRVRAAELVNAQAGVRVTTAQTALNEAKVNTVAVAEATAAVNSTQAKFKIADDNLVKATRKKDDAQAKATEVETAQTVPIEEAKKAVKAAEDVRTAIGKAGSRMLYPHIGDGKQNVYTAVTLTDSEGTASLANSRVNRFRLVGFPEFSTTSFTQGDLSGLIPLEAMSLGVNISNTNVSKVTVKVPAAESYALSIQDTIDALGTLVQDNQKQLSWTLKPETIKFIKAARAQTNYLDWTAGPADSEETFETARKGKIYFRVITEVYYARAIDVSIFSANAFGAKVQASPPVATGAGVGSTATTSSAGSGATGAAVPINTSVVGNPVGADMLSSLQARLANTQTVPGGTVQLVSYNDMSIGLRRVFDKPIAIGFRGLVLEYDIQKNTFTKVKVGSSFVPTSNPGNLDR